MNNLKHIDHGKYIIDNIKYINYDCTNPNVKTKEYKVNNDDDILSNDKFAYSQIIYNNNPMVYVTTPMMVCPFGFNKNLNTMNLQFTNYKLDEHMNSFLEFIKNIEFQQMLYLNLDEDNSELYSSQIKYSKNDKYDPTLVVKFPFQYNKYDVDIYNDNLPLSIFNIQKFNKLTCDIYIDKIWRFNDQYICKWKVRRIYVH